MGLIYAVRASLAAPAIALYIAAKIKSKFAENLNFAEIREKQVLSAQENGIDCAGKGHHLHRKRTSSAQKKETEVNYEKGWQQAHCCMKKKKGVSKTKADNLFPG